MKKRFSTIQLLIILSVLSFSAQSLAQSRDFLFKYFKQKKTFTYGLNNRQTKMLVEPSSIYSGYIGIKYGNQLKHVITVNSTVFWIGDYQESPTLEPMEMQLNYVGLAEEFRFLKYNRWSFSSYIHLGAGKGRFRNSFPLGSRWLFPLETGIHGAYALNKWLEIKGGAGYRYVFHSQGLPLHGFYYKLSIGLNFQVFKSWALEVCKSISNYKRKLFPMVSPPYDSEGHLLAFSF